MKRFLFLGSTLLLAAAAIVPARADSCRAGGAVCLFSDGSGCAITCGHGECAYCVTGGCILGFGYDAECSCRPCPVAGTPVVKGQAQLGGG